MENYFENYHNSTFFHKNQSSIFLCFEVEYNELTDITEVYRIGCT